MMNFNQMKRSRFIDFHYNKFEKSFYSGYNKSISQIGKKADL